MLFVFLTVCLFSEGDLPPGAPVATTAATIASPTVFEVGRDLRRAWTPPP